MRVKLQMNDSSVLLASQCIYQLLIFHRHDLDAIAVVLLPLLSRREVMFMRGIATCIEMHQMMTIALIGINLSIA